MGRDVLQSFGCSAVKGPWCKQLALTRTTREFPFHWSYRFIAQCYNSSQLQMKADILLWVFVVCYLLLQSCSDVKSEREIVLKDITTTRYLCGQRINNSQAVSSNFRKTFSLNTLLLSEESALYLNPDCIQKAQHYTMNDFQDEVLGD